MLLRNVRLLFGTLMASVLTLGGAQIAIAQVNLDATPFDDDDTPGSLETQGGSADDFDPLGRNPEVPSQTPFEEEAIPGSEESRGYPTEDNVDDMDGDTNTVPTETPFEEEAIPGDEEGRTYE